MNNKDLVKSTIQHKETGKVPYCIHLAGCGFKKHSQDLLKRYASVTVKKLLDKEVITPDQAVKLAIGNKAIGVSCPWWSWYEVPSCYKTDFEAPSFMPKTIGRGNYDEFIEKVKILKELTGSYITVLIWGTHFEKAQFARGIENFLADMAGDPEFTHKILDKIISKNLVMLDNIINIAEIDGILLGSDWGSQRDLLISREMWLKYIAEGEQKEYDLIKSGGKDVWIHSCGNVEKIIPDLIKMGVDVLNPIQPECMDIYKIKEQYGKDITFWGGISTQQTLPYGTKAEVVAETRKIIEAMSKGGGYITAPSQEIQEDVPFENLCALIDTAKEYA